MNRLNCEQNHHVKNIKTTNLYDPNAPGGDANSADRSQPDGRPGEVVPVHQVDHVGPLPWRPGVLVLADSLVLVSLEVVVLLVC